MLPVLNHCHEWTPLIEIERKYRYHQKKLRSTYYRQKERNGKCCKCLSSSSNTANSSTSMSLLCSSSFHQVHEGHTPSFHFTFFLIFLCFFFFWGSISCWILISIIKCIICRQGWMDFFLKENMLVVNSLLIQFKISFSIVWCLVKLQLCMFGCWESSRKLIEKNSVKIENLVVWNRRSVPKLRFKLEIWVCYWITF